MSIAKSSSPSSGYSSSSKDDGAAFKTIAFFFRVPFFSHLNFHLMGFEISNEAGEVHLLSIVELLEGCCLDFPSFRESSNDVMPRSRRYGDVTVTYIRRSKIPSHIYAKHQYR